MARTSASSWTLVMPNPQAAFTTMPKTAGVKMQLRLPMVQKIWRVHVWCWRRRHYGPHGWEKLPVAPGKKPFSQFSQESTRKWQIRDFSLSVNQEFFSWVFGFFFLGSPKPGICRVFFLVPSPGVFFPLFFWDFLPGPPMPGFCRQFQESHVMCQC